MPTEPSLAPTGGGLSSHISSILVATYMPPSSLHKRPSLWGPVVPSLPCSDRLAGLQGVTCIWAFFLWGGGVLEEYLPTSPSALRMSPPPGLLPGYPNLETPAECKDLLSAERKGCCVQGRRRFGTQDSAHFRGAEGQSSIHPEDPGTLLLPQFKNCVTCVHCITDYTEDAITLVVHAAVTHLEWNKHLLFTRCSLHTTLWTLNKHQCVSHIHIWTTQLNRRCRYPHQRFLRMSE